MTDNEKEVAGIDLAKQLYDAILPLRDALTYRAVWESVDDPAAALERLDAAIARAKLHLEGLAATPFCEEAEE